MLPAWMMTYYKLMMAWIPAYQADPDAALMIAE
jgi:hypothetical protein